ncbi:hypothetical protein ZZ1p0067 [Acinetobacter phage ZZ1]|uniref:Uncharacterized protein n=2 Tax=Caudoviricetes TaxID=2731619 RepID=I3WVM7_9CAUD|nr:hypothetical protein ZZ1p0067 [Acinetobacter phage ZZ1]AFL47547.1 hypothetical protein ZZ1p0067 [Acinetobacter phage ZZ1]
MSNRDGKGAKRNSSKKFSSPLRKCPKCQSSLDKCGDHNKPGHADHRICKTCNYSNF